MPSAADQEPDPGRQERGEAERLTDDEKEIVATRTPLWFYILREAETGNGKMRGVGARIVAETFHRAMEGSRFSILRSPTSSRGMAAGTTFEMTDLLFFAFGEGRGSTRSAASDISDLWSARPHVR